MTEHNDSLTHLADALREYVAAFADGMAVFADGMREFVDAMNGYMAANGTALLADIDKRVLVGDLTPEQADAIRTVINDVMKETTK